MLYWIGDSAAVPGCCLYWDFIFSSSGVADVETPTQCESIASACGSGIVNGVAAGVAFDYTACQSSPWHGRQQQLYPGSLTTQLHPF